MKKTVVLAALAILASTSYAGKMVAPNVELVSEEQWTTGSASGHTEDSHVFFSSATVGAHVSSAYGHVYQNISMSASHSFSMTNSESGNKSYRIVMRLCADNNCTYDSRSYTLYGRGNYSSSATSYLTSSFTHVGTYDLIAKTEMSGDAGSNYESRASVYVSK